MIGLARSLFGIILVCAMVDPAQALTFNTYKTATGGELISTLSGNSGDQVLYSLDVSSISSSPSDILVVESEFEMQNDGSSTAHLTAHVVLASSSTSTSGTELGVATTQGISPSMHRNKRYKGAIKLITGGLSNHYINVCVSSDEDLTVRMNRGGLQVLKISY